MKAVVITGSRRDSLLEWREVADPIPGETDLLVRVKASALNRADVLQRRGLYPAPEGTRQDIPGLEYSGVVEWVGSRTEVFKRGDRVMGILPGEGHAELVATPACTSMKIPAGLTFEEAAAIPEAFLTAYDGLALQLKVKSGETLLIHAVGSGVGTAAVQLAKLYEVRTIGTSRSAAKLENAACLGLDHPILTGSSNLSEKIHRSTGGKGVSAILDLVGASLWDVNLDCLAPRGRILIVGLVGGNKVELNLGLVLTKRLHITGTVLRGRTLSEKAKLVQEFQRIIVPLFDSQQLKPVIDTEFPIQEIEKAHSYMEANRNLGKIVLRIA